MEVTLKILYVITKSNWGGAQRYVYDLATALPKKHWDVGVLLGGSGLPGEGGGKLEEELRHADIRTLFIPTLRRDVSLRAEWRAFRNLLDLFAQEQPDIVHLNSSKAGALGALAARISGVPLIVFTAHGLAFNEDRPTWQRILIWLAQYATLLLCHRAIAVSRSVASGLKSMPFVGHKITTIHLGVHEPAFLPREDARAFVTARAHAPGPGIWIGTLAELTWNKGLHTLVRAVSELKRKGIDCALFIMGEGEERTFLETLRTEESVEDRVHLLGFVPEGARYLPAFDIFALPSYTEALGYSLIEAGLAGLPAVATRVGGIPEIIEDKLQGYLVPPNHAGQLADRLAELIADPGLRERFGSALRQKVSEEFSIAHMVEATIAAYVR